MGNSALGAALSIPKSALDAIKEADQKLKDIQSTAKNTAAGVTKSFNGMAVGTQPFLDALDKVIAKLNTINTSATSASSGLSNIGASAGSMNGNITQASQNIQQMVAQLSNMKGAGTSSIMQAVFAFQRLQEATKGASGMNIAELKKEIGGIDSILKDTSYNLTKTDQDSLIKRKKILQDELKYQQQMCEERVIAFQKALDRMSSAEASFNAKQRKAYSDRSKKYQEQNYEQNTSYKGALDFSAAANTLNRQARAIEYLKEARMKLSQTDADYKQKLETLNAAIARHTQNLKEAGVSSRNLSEQTSYMSSYISRWAQRMAFAFSINTVQGFVEQIAEVRGQFELSQRSLEAILQNKPKADEIFNKTVELAVKSPFRIKDLVDYTRQLSAYRIESNKLYDTTKRLADVSAGLGVDMSRLILAYGQVKAAAYLRGTEVRQFTEAGINMYGELQQYFKEVKGEAYTTAQIVDMISKRKVTFEDVEAIFQRMTDKGGIFYNMQEIQAETLQGKISNLKDAIDVMLNSIGKDNEGAFKGMISATTALLNNWKAIAAVGRALITILATLKARSLFLNSTLGIAFSQASGSGIARYKALFVNAFGSMGKALKSFGAVAKSSLAGLGVFAAIEVVTTVISKWNDYNKAVKEAQEESIKTRGAIATMESSYNELAKAAGDANSKLAGSELEQNINDRRVALQKLIDLAAKEGLVFKINVDALNESELDATFERIKKKYTGFVDDIEVIERKYAKNGNWNTWFTDGLDDDMSDYKNAVVDALAMSSQMETAIALVNSNYDKATDKTKKYFDEIRAGQKDGETNLEYWRRMVITLNRLNTITIDENRGIPDWLKNGHLDSFSSAFLDIQKSGNELISEFDNIFGDLKTKYKGDKVLIQAVIDRTAARHDWDQYSRELAYRHFGINISVDKKTTEEEVSWVDDYIANFFAKRKYGVNLVVKKIDDDGAVEDFIKAGDKAGKAAKAWKEAERRIFKGVAKNTKTVKVSEEIRSLFGPNDPRVSGKTIDVSTLREMFKQYKEAATQEALALGVNPFEKEGKKVQKEQRDMLQERISLLKDMNAKYNDLIKTESREVALAKTRKYFKEAAQNVGFNSNDILPDDKSIAKRIREIGNQYKEVGKRGNALRIAADIDLNISKTEYDKLKDDISRNIEDSFSQLQLYKKLKGEGLSDTLIKNMFGDITTSFEDIRNSIDDEFNKHIIKDYESKYGKDITKWGQKTIEQYNADLNNTANVLKERFGDSDIYKQYLDQVQKLDKQVYQDQVEQTQELIKAYKQQLSDQLQLDKWYYEERYKLENDPNLTKDLKKQLQANLDTQYKKKTDENTWKDFKESDMYIAIFENLDQTSSRVLTAMRKKLNSLRGELKNLSPEQLKQIVQQMEKVDELLADRNPFKGLSNDIAEYVKFASKRNQLEKDYIKSTEKEDSLKDRSISQNKEVELAKQKYESAVKKHGEDSEEAGQAQDIYDIEKRKLDIILEELEAQGKISKKLAEQIRNGQAAEKSLTQKIRSIGEGFSDVANIVNGTFEALNDWGLNIEMGDELQEIVGGIGQIGSSLSEIDLTKPFSVIKGTVGLLGGIGKTLGGIFGWGTKDKKLQKQIEKHQKSIEKLQDAYNDLKEAMNDAFDISMLAKYNNEMVKNLKTQNAHLEAMIKAESSKKKKDKDKIAEYQKQIKENEKAIKEAEESLTEQLGGFGSKSNYKSAAEAFAQAWVDAFGEGSDALDALNNKFNEYIKNLIVKQATTRLVGKMIEPILKAVDEAVSEGSEGGNKGLEVTKSELQKIIDMWGQVGPVLDENLKSLMNAMGYKPGLNSNLSALQQGIQAVTENTAQTLESILNSCRWYIAQQQQDIRAIRALLEERLGNIVSQSVSGGSSNQMVALMEQQVGYLREICDNWASVMKTGHSQGGRGLKVFMN